MADGGVYIPINLQVDEAEKQIHALSKKIAKTELELKFNTTELDNARKQFEALQEEAVEIERQIYKIGKQNRKGEWVAYDKDAQGELDKLVQRLNEIDSKADPLGEKVAKLTEENDKLNGSLSETRAQFSAYTDEYTELMKAVTAYNERQARQETGKEVAPAVNATQGALNTITPFKDMLSETADEIGKAFRFLAEDIANVGINAVKWLGNHFLEILGRLGNAVIKVAVEFNPFVRIIRSLAPAIKRIVGLAQRALIFNVISRGFRAMTTEISRIVAGNSQLSKSLSALKGAFLTAFEPIISWAIPIITRLLNLITQLAGALANLTAGWFGKTAKQAQDNAKALNKQAKATAGASKATKSLMSIDEINQLSDKSGGGGSSASPTFNNDLSFDAGGWFENLGTDIATKINEAIASVDWLELGHKVGKGLQKMLDVSLDFLRKINFKSMGEAIANFINGAINEVHPAQIGEALWRVFKSGYDLLVGFITTFDWKQFGMHLLRIAKSIAIQFAEAMREIDWQGIANRVYTFMRDFFSQQDWWEIAKNVLQGLANGLLGLVTILWNAITGVVRGFIDLFKKLLGINSPSTVFADIGVQIMQGLINGIKSLWNSLVALFTNMWTTLKNTITGAVSGIKTACETVWSTIKGVFSTVGTWFRDTFSNAWQKVKDVFSKGGATFEGIKEGISTTFKTIVNGLIGGINAVIAVPFTAINNALRKVRDLSIAGLTPFKGKISLVNIPSIPYLAQGTVVPPNNKFLAMLGDNKSETEIVSPLSTMKEALTQALAESRQNITVNVDGRELFNIVVGQNNAEVRRTGESPLMV